MKKRSSLSSSSIMLIVAACLVAVCAPLVLWIRHAAKMGSVSFTDALNTILYRVAHPFPIDPDHMGAVLLTLLMMIFLLIAAVLILVAVIKLIVGAGKSEEQKRHMGLKTANALSNTAIHIILVIISVIWLLPFIFIVLQSFRVESTYQVGYIIPQEWGLDNYKSIFSAESNFPRWYLNTFIMALATAALQTIIVLCMSYTLSRFRFKMRKPLMKFMLVLGMFPGILGMIILYRILSDLGLTQAHAVPGLILVYVASSGMGYYVSKGFFDTLPKSLDEAARVDGATRAQVLFRIILPLSKPIVIYTILTAFMAPWGDFVFAKYAAMNDRLGMNVAVGMNTWLATPTMLFANYTKFCAGGVVVAIPVVILFMCLQRYYVEGVTGGAVKG